MTSCQSLEEQVELIDDGIETTDEELQAFHIVRAIAAQEVDPARIGYRDAKTYCPILLDDNNRQTICRLRFNNVSRLRIGLFDAERAEVVYEIDRIEEIYQYADQIRETVRGFQ